MIKIVEQQDVLTEDIKSVKSHFEEIVEDFEPVLTGLKGTDKRQNCNDCIAALWCGTLCLSCINNIFICCSFLGEFN